MFGKLGPLDLERHDAIRRALRARGVKLIDIAAETGRHPSLVTQTCQGYRLCADIEEAIARRLGVEVAALFPERYAAARNGKEDPQ